MKASLRKNNTESPEITVEFRLSSNSDLTCTELETTLAALTACLNESFKSRMRIKGKPEQTSFQRFTPDFYCEDRFKVTFSVTPF